MFSLVGWLDSSEGKSRVAVGVGVGAGWGKEGSLLGLGDKGPGTVRFVGVSQRPSSFKLEALLVRIQNLVGREGWQQLDGKGGRWGIEGKPSLGCATFPW